MFKKWIAENAPWLGFIVMALLGGVVAHIRAWERAGVVIPVSDHVKGLIVRSCYAGMAGLLIYWSAQAAIEYGYKVSEPLTFVFAGIGGMFGAELFDFLLSTGSDYARKKLGLPPRPDQQGKP